MKPKKICNSHGLLFQNRLSKQLNPTHTLFQLRKLIDWQYYEKEFAGYFIEKKGAPALPVQLVVGMIMLQHMNQFSDEDTIQQWLENSYWQYFCGYDYFQWESPINASSLSRWRKRLGKEGIEKILKGTIEAAIKSGAVSQKSLSEVIVDTTVMCKNITFPTDSKLYHTGIKTLVRMCEDNEIELRQTYKFLAKKALRKCSQYAHARQMKRSQKEKKRLHTYLGRLVRDVKRKIFENEYFQTIFKGVLEILEKVLLQSKNSKDKIYSIHEPHVECISKGKSHKKFEFGCKTSIVITHKEGLALSVQALHGNPYDGHTLQKALEDAEKNTNKVIKQVYADKGYRGHGITDKEVHISCKKTPQNRKLYKKIKRRQAIEPHIGHLKNDGKLGVNYLKGRLGDVMNALLCGVGHNLRLITRKLAASLRQTNFQPA